MEYAGLDFVQRDGEWIPDEGSYDSALEYSFMLYC